MESVVSCEVCGEETKFWAEIDNYSHFRCGQCGHLFVFPRPSQVDLDAFYRGGQYYDAAVAEQNRLLREASERINRLSRLSERFGLDKKLLDVGCANGYFIKQVLEEGWRVTGIDRSDELVRQAREYSGAEVLSGLLEKIKLVNGPYSIVTAWEVIEHTINPRTFFSALAKNVGAGGLIALSTPLANGLPAQVLGSKFPMLTPPEHLSLFTRRSINLLAAEFGFEEISYRSFSNLGPSSLASGFSKLIIRRDLEGSSKISRFFCYLLGISLSWVPMIVDLAGRGTEMEIVFRRNKK